MIPGLRLTCAVVGLAAVASTGAPAGPTFSAWSAPVNLGPAINTPSTDAGPALSTDGLSLFFNSNRAGGSGDHDIWVSQRASVDAPWGVPRNLGPIVNSAASEAVPALSRDGHWLFFNSNRAGGYGNNDLWVSYRAHTNDDFAWEAPVNLGDEVNTPGFDVGASFYENDEWGLPLLFFGSTRPGGLGSFDIYVSPVMADGSVGPATPVTELNTNANDQRPSVRFDGLEVFLQSDRAGSAGGADLWTATRESSLHAWSVAVNLGATVNTTSTEQQPHIAADRETLLFASNRPGAFGGLDLYMTTRTKIAAR